MVGRSIDEHNVDSYINELKNRTKGQYINQGVAFNKSCKRQMALLRQALLDSSSFSGLIKEMLAIKYNRNEEIEKNSKPLISIENKKDNKEKPAVKDLSGWI